MVVIQNSHFHEKLRNFFLFLFIYLLTGTLPLYLFYYFLLYTVLVCKFRPQESQSDVLGDLRIYRMISLVVGSYFDMPPLLFLGLEPASLGTSTVLTRVRCLSLQPDMDREVRSHPDSRISAKVQSSRLRLSRVLRPNDHRNHPELRHVSSLHYRLRHQSCQINSKIYIQMVQYIACLHILTLFVSVAAPP
jgi:hypothetical protein